MPDIDPGLIGQVMNSIPYDQAFGAPLAAAIDSQTKAANSALNFLLKVGFEKTTDENGREIQQTRYAEFEFEETRSDGAKQVRRLKIPLILLINLPQLEISEGIIMFDLEISQSAQVKEDISVGGEAEAKIGWGPFSVSFKAKASYSKESTRKTDTRAKQHVQMTIKQAEPPEALNVMMEIMRDACLGASSGGAPNLSNIVPRGTNLTPDIADIEPVVQ